jgi:hypothetical protein
VIVDTEHSDVTGDGGITPDGTLICFFDQRTHDEDGIDRTVRTGCIRSTDGGQTWGEFRPVDNRGWASYSTYGKMIPREAGDSSELLKPVVGRTAVDHPEGLHHRGETWLLASRDDGRSWEYRGTIYETTPDDHYRNETAVAELPGGVLLAVVRWQGAGFEQYHSTDGGNTWHRDGVTTIGNTGVGVSPALFVAGEEVRFVGGHRTPYHTKQNVQWMSYATATADEVVNSPENWRDHIWFVQSVAGENMMGYPEVASLQTATVVAFSWRRSDGAITLSLVREKAIRQLITGAQHIRYDGEMDERSIAPNQPVFLNSHETVHEADAPTTADWTEEDLNRIIPGGSREAILVVGLRSGDETPASVYFRAPGRVDFSSYSRDHALVDSTTGPQARSENPSFETCLSVPEGASSTMYRQLRCPLTDGQFEWSVDREASVDIAVAGFV